MAIGGAVGPQALRIFGDKALIAALNALPDRVYRKVVRQSMGRAITPMVRAMRKEAKRHQGKTRKKGKHLWKTIGKQTRTYKSRSNILCTAGPGWPAGAHGHLLEWGHRAVGRAAGKWSRRSGRRLTVSRVRGHPWMTPAYDATKSQVLAIMQRELVQKVEAAATELGRTSA